MSLELTAIPLAFLAGMVSVLSPCVWPLVPIVMGSAANTSRLAPCALALGLSVSFALAGTILSFMLVSTGLNPELFRYVAAVLMLLVALTLLYAPLGEWVSIKLSSFSSRFNPSDGGNSGLLGQFSLGLLLGLVWLPCVGPTLGAAIALASMGQEMSKAFLIMLSFGMGTALVLLAAGILSHRTLRKLSPHMLSSGQKVKKLLGWLLLMLALLVLTGLDKQMEIWAVSWLPAWSISI